MKPIRLGVRMLGYYALFVVVSLILMFMILSAPRALQIVLGIALCAGFGLVLFNDGGYIGEKAVSLQKLLEKRREEGRGTDAENESAAFQKKTALIAFIVAVFPLFLMAAVNLAYEPVYSAKLDAYVEQYGPIETLDESLETTVLENGNKVYPADTEGGSLEGKPVPPSNYLTVAARVVFMPFIVFLTGLEENITLYNLMLVLCAFIMPAFGIAGYLNGPKLHEKKLKAIEMGVRRKKRMARLERAKREPKEPKREV